MSVELRKRKRTEFKRVSDETRAPTHAHEQTRDQGSISLLWTSQFYPSNDHE